ncbi:MAG: sigma-54 dependent transcriptional regulator [Thermodesulfobacteriota bacterium]|nr:sigma-54 dependent transcriptional regulator [Thermodesulfobacteriota bacterium]
MEKARILIVDDDEIARKSLSRLLYKEGYYVSSAKSGFNALSLLSKTHFDLVITDMVMEEMDGLDLLLRVKLNYPHIEVVVITGYASISTSVEAMKKGAFYYLEKPFRSEDIRHLVRQVVEKADLRKQLEKFKQNMNDYPAEPLLIGESREILEVVKLIRQIAKTDCNILVTGESGTGKELVAALIHYHSNRSKQRFMGINCGGFAEDLLANELFGHEKGAFTGATSQKAGLLEAASGGTLFFDEIGMMPLSMQIKLLRAIQEQEVIRVGGNKPVPIDIRIIAATNKDLKKAIDARLFREDLYYRLNVISIKIPPLRNRRKDIPLLANFFINRANKKTNKKIRGFSDQTMKLLVNYDYPGNVRELENIVERAVAMTNEETIQICDLPPDLSRIKVFSFEYSNASIKTLKEIQREYIQWVLDLVGRNKTEAAKILGIDRASLWRHLKKYEIEE